MSNLSPETFNILFNKKWTKKDIDKVISEVDRNALCREYEKLKQYAPRRSDRKKCYFVGHDGNLSTAARSNRYEEHLAIALWNLNKCWPSLGGGRFRLLDYQLPLYAQQSDKGIGEVDLLGVAVECMALDKLADIAYGPDGKTPQLNRVPALCPVRPDNEPPIGEALSLPSA